MELTDQNADEKSALFSKIIRVNKLRALGCPPDHYHDHVKEIAQLIESLYKDWLRPRFKDDDAQDAYLFVVRPYLSTRYFYRPSKRPVDILTISKKQRANFIRDLSVELPEIGNESFLKAMLTESMQTLEEFFATIQHSQIQ